MAAKIDERRSIIRVGADINDTSNNDRVVASRIDLVGYAFERCEHAIEQRTPIWRQTVADTGKLVADWAGEMSGQCLLMSAQDVDDELTATRPARTRLRGALAFRFFAG